MERFAVLIDLSVIRLGANMFRKLYSDLSLRGTVEYLKFYNYNTKRHREFRSLIKEYGAEVDLPLQGKKRVRVDIRQVIDGVKIASTCANITTFFLICAEVDGLYLFNELKKAGKLIEMGVTSPTTLSDKAHSVYILDRSEEVEGEVAVALEEKDSDSSGDVIEVSKVKGDANSIFPYSDIQNEELNAKMAEIDKKILDIIGKRSQNQGKNLSKIFGDIQNK